MDLTAFVTYYGFHNTMEMAEVKIIKGDSVVSSQSFLPETFQSIDLMATAILDYAIQAGATDFKQSIKLVAMPSLSIN